MEWLLGLAVGVLAGAIGIGGVLVVPVLSVVFDHGIEVAIASASSSFLLPAAVACATYHRRGEIPWPIAMPLCIVMMPGVCVGVLLGVVLPTTALGLVTSLLLLASGLHQLFTRKSAGEVAVPGSVPSGASGAAMSLGVGAASALTGTGGPVLLSPILLWRRVPVRTVIGISQAIALPIAAVASLGYGLTGRVDFELAAILGISQAAGVPLGAALARRSSSELLRAVVAIAILTSGLLLLVRTIA